MVTPLLKIFKWNPNLLYIGDGAYSLVYKVKRISDGQEYALKKVKISYHISSKYIG